jgi:quinol monooxygenase YgiN
MIVIQGFIRTAHENAAKFRQAAAPLIAATRQEVGCIEYAFAEDIGDPGLFHVIERWADDASNAAHATTPHFAAFSAALPAIGLTGIRIARYDAEAEKVLFGA